MARLLINIPLRQMWFDELPDWMTTDKGYLFKIAVSMGHLHLVKSLIRELLAENGGFIIPLIATKYLRYAVINGDSATVGALLEIEGINASGDCNFALRHAVCQHGYIDIVKLLLEKGRVDPTRTR
ncbi:hypothetical protein HDU76_006707 [Blyttiomyces sp. JEL0837]|nr:hypothetical protein HDU76_006707 [Blyttiomyces sp. JEL0837]